MVADKNTKYLLSKKETYIKVSENPNCLGYANATQQTQESHKILTTFEFNCWKLSQFKIKYDL